MVKKGFNWNSLRNLFIFLILTTLIIPLLMVVFFSITYQPTTEAKKVERENQAQKTPLNDGPSTSPEPEAKLFHLNEETSTNVTPPPPALPPPPPVNPVPPPPTTPAETYTVTVTSNGTISPASLTISVGSVVNFVYTNPNDEVILTFSLNHQTTSS